MSKETLLNEWREIRTKVLDALENTDEDLMHTVPKGYPNSLHWQFGHIAATAEMVSQTVFNHEDDVKDRFTSYFGYGTSPQNDFDDDTPTLKDIYQLLETQLDYFDDYLTEELMSKEMPENQFNAKTNEEFITVFMGHEREHVELIDKMKSDLIQEREE